MSPQEVTPPRRRRHEIMLEESHPPLEGGHFFGTSDAKTLGGGRDRLGHHSVPIATLIMVRSNGTHRGRVRERPCGQALRTTWHPPLYALSIPFVAIYRRHDTSTRAFAVSYLCTTLNVRRSAFRVSRSCEHIRSIHDPSDRPIPRGLRARSHAQ